MQKCGTPQTVASGLLPVIVTMIAILVPESVVAGEITSEYTRLDFENGCVWKMAESEEEAQMGGEAICAGYRGYPVHFAEGDLRQFVRYGPVADEFAYPGGFAEWNRVNDVIEWRLDDGMPFATIHRWFIENINPETGSADKQFAGQVLVISTVADPFASVTERKSCVVGFVDALSNTDANTHARRVADGLAHGFRCGTDAPHYHGDRGPLSGTPNN